ncbi:TetR/AcrR family transcriptional regulator [Phytomonospora endophytica]|uniref:DNA-binding transcriptional regulator YbjK n=1 Tax=Phytomonospora endophytica TaxID=714109 RepID=A0A841FEY6_9ACTN|nr:TetR/AcrR family transcriptional regulator [Phytomonospora endophytica]MBB6034404.1 DNA-binding transcriptional regulator YbjK [Phytomonospora endophytica]GIG66798.1 hypothetical protein Pen01_30930 [Phytomonospora endophytica]
MPPPNARRREQLADAAVTVLAAHGSRGLTHRAVDTAADVPAGTTSRYFRTREALVDAVVERITRRLADRVAAVRIRPLERADLEDALVTTLTRMLDEDDVLVLFELHLEATRDPALRGVLTAALAERRDLILRQCRVAGVDVTGEDAELLEMGVLGILFTTLTTDAPGGPGPRVRAAVGGLLSRYAA